MSCREDLPRFIEPMLPRTGPLPVEEARYAASVKFDGMRAQISVDARGRVCVRSRPGRNHTHRFPELAEFAAAIRDAGHRQVLLDGELVVLDSDAKPNFGRLAARIRASSDRQVARAAATHPCHLVLFDALHLDGANLRHLPYVERHEILRGLQLHAPYWQTTPHFIAEAAALFAAVEEQQLEGIVVKHLDSRYEAGRRSGSWIKHKVRRVHRLVGLRWVTGRGDEPDGVATARRGHDGRLVPAGVVAFGLTGAQRARLRRELEHRPVGEVLVDVAAHDRRGGMLGDPVLRGYTIATMR